MVVLKNVLVATDFGEAANGALMYGRQLARSFGATLHLVHVIDDFNARAISVAGFPEYLSSLSRLQLDAHGTAEVRLSGLLSDEDRSALAAKAVVLTSASPAQVLVDYAKRQNIDLIVAGTHGRGAVGHLFMGSVAERLVRSAPCAVLTVRQAQRDFVRPDALQPVERT